MPRIHLGLLSMHRNAPRINGGIGFAVDGPCANIDATPAARLTVRDDRSNPMAATERGQLKSALELFFSAQNLNCAAEIRIGGEMQTHVGLGSATAIRLGAIEALATLNGYCVSRQELVTASGRGGTSGIGINTYFDGGLICDLGKPNQGQSILPSSQADQSGLPMTVPKLVMPNWPMLLCIPRAITPKTQEEEITFFARTAPIDETSSFEASYVALFAIYASVAEADYTAFCDGVRRMQCTAWKRAERAEYGNALALINAALIEAGADCTGMSSLGPLVYCFAPSAKLSEIAEAAQIVGCDVFKTTPRNSGRDIQIYNA